MWPAPLACLTLGLLCGASDRPDPETLVRRLGSPRFVEREEATTALLDLGRDAVRALKSARVDGDAEVQARAAWLLDSIDRRMLTLPTRLPLDPGERSLGLLVRQFADRTGFDLEPARGGDATRSILVEAQPDAEVEPTFWDAVDRAGLEPEWNPREAPRFGAPTPVQAMRLGRAAVPPGIHTNAGPFRLAVKRTAPLRPEPEVLRLDRAAPKRLNRAEEPEEFDLRLELSSEPRLRIRPAGVVQVLEARDDRGNDLIGPGGSDRPQAMLEASGTSSPFLPLTLSLNRPEADARVIQRLRVRVPVQIEGRKSEPIELPLTGDAAATRGAVWCGDGFLIVQNLARVPGRDTWRLDMTLQPEDWRERFGPGMRMGGQRRMQFDPSLFDRMWSSIELIDAQGERLNPAIGRTARMTPEGFLVSIEFPTEAQAPVRLRYHGVIREQADLSFELTEIPLRPGR